MNDTIKISGKVELTKRRNGRTLWHRTERNLVVDAGLALVASRMADSADAVPTHIAVGSSATATTAGMTALQGTEHDRQACVNTHSSNTTTYTATIGAGIAALVTVNEIGIFNAAAAGTMLARFLTSTFTLNAGETLSVAWTITYEG